MAGLPSAMWRQAESLEDLGNKFQLTKWPGEFLIVFVCPDRKERSDKSILIVNILELF